MLAYCQTLYFQSPRQSIANTGFMQDPIRQQMAKVFAKDGQSQIRVPDQAYFMQTLNAMGATVFSGKSASKPALDEAARLLQNEVGQMHFTGTTE